MEMWSLITTGLGSNPAGVEFSRSAGGVSDHA